ncbi:MAG: hypothetical protein ACKO6L_12230, partial [Flavobacteriales bacterium]
MITQHKIAASLGTGVLGLDEYDLKLNSSKWSSIPTILHQRKRQGLSEDKMSIRKASVAFQSHASIHSSIRIPH